MTYEQLNLFRAETVLETAINQSKRQFGVRRAEAGINDNEDYAYGWCERGKRFEALKLGYHTTWVSMIAALQNHELIAPLTFEGYCNRRVFETWRLLKFSFPHFNSVKP